MKYLRSWLVGVGAILMVGLLALACNDRSSRADSTKVVTSQRRMAILQTQQTHSQRDSLLGVKLRTATDSADGWQQGKQPLWLKRQWAMMYAIADSLIKTKMDTSILPPLPDSQPPVDTQPPPQPQPEPPPVDTSTGVAALPQDSVDAAYPAITRRYAIGTNIQQALDTAKAGDELVLASNTTYTLGTGGLLWTRCLASPVVLTGPSGPAVGTRVTPRLAILYPKLIVSGTAAAVLVKNGGCNLRLSRLEVSFTAASATTNYNYGLVKIGDAETSLSGQPKGIVLDRVYLHGSPDIQTQNAVIFNGQRLAIVDSWVDQVRWKGVESHCVIGYKGVGPFLIQSNHLDCAGIGILFGGARRAIAGRGPADITVRGNHITKDTSYIGYVAKNGFELKDAQRVLLENNVIEHSYYGAQTGMILNIQSLTDEGDTTVQTTDVTVRWNKFNDGAQCFMASARGYNGVAKPMTRVEMHDNLCTGVGNDSLSRVATISGDIHNLTIRHNTFIRNATPAKNQGVIPDGGPASGITFLNNVFGNGQLYGCVFRSGGATGMAAWQAYDPNAKVAGNVCWANAGSKTPAADFFPASKDAVGFNADWSLSASSPYKGKGTDGKDPGADIAELTRRTAGVVVQP